MKPDEELGNKNLIFLEKWHIIAKVCPDIDRTKPQLADTVPIISWSRFFNVFVVYVNGGRAQPFLLP